MTEAQPKPVSDHTDQAFDYIQLFKISPNEGSQVVVQRDRDAIKNLFGEQAWELMIRCFHHDSYIGICDPDLYSDEEVHAAGGAEEIEQARMKHQLQYKHVTNVLKEEFGIDYERIKAVERELKESHNEL